MATKYDEYVIEIKSEIASCLQTKACQPILFIGSGFSRRHFNGPSWDELLALLGKQCPNIDKDYTYYKQLYNGDMLKIGEVFAQSFHEWAWGEGRANFDDNLFKDTVPTEAYIKHAIAKHLREVTPKNADYSLGKTFEAELTALKSIRPHAIITTNYDQFIELLFPDYAPIIGQQIIQSSSVSIGEIFKIHGCISDPLSLVFTDSDYVQFTKRKKYLSAKLLTFFSEHPLLFVGYSANDPNIKTILSDIDEALPVSGGIIQNVYILEWDRGLQKESRPAREKLIAIDESKSVRINAIESKDFTWVFEAFASNQSINSVSPKVLRAILSRSYELVRCDIPRTTFHADFQLLEHAVQNQSEFAKLFGITTINEPSLIAVNYPYTLTQVAHRLKANYWTKAQDAINAIKAKHGFDVKTCDNKYHHATKYGKTRIHKYSEDAVTLFQKVLSGYDYEIEIPGGGSENQKSAGKLERG